MSTLSELQKKLQQESQGIMFPFSAATNAVDTTQQVYDSSTDGIMTMTGKKYVGPDAVIQYGTEEEGFPRQLKQIEAPMLPQVSNLPPAGTGIMELAPGASTPEPISTDPVVEQPAVDPCPPGYQLINGVCQLIQQQSNDKDKQPTFNNKPRNIGNTAKTASSISAAIKNQGGTGNFGETLNITLDNNNFLTKIPPVGLIATVLNTIGKFVKGFEDKRDLGFGKTEGNNIYNIEGGADTISTDGINVTKNKDGTLNAAITQKGKTQFGDIITSESMQGNLASTQATDANGNIITAPNGQKQIVGPLTLGLGTTGSKDSYYGIGAGEKKFKALPEDQQGTTTGDIEATETGIKTAPGMPRQFGELKTLEVALPTTNNNPGGTGGLTTFFDNEASVISNSYKKIFGKFNFNEFPNYNDRKTFGLGGFKKKLQDKHEELYINKLAQDEKKVTDRFDKEVSEATTTTNVYGITKHEDRDGNVLGYSNKENPGVINVAGMPPIGPGQRIMPEKKDRNTTSDGRKLGSRKTKANTNTKTGTRDQRFN